MFDYYRFAGFGRLPVPNPDYARYLDVVGTNRLQVAFSFVQGKESLPAWSLYGDEKTGPYSDGPGRTAWSVCGRKALVFVDGGLEVYDRSTGLLVGLMGPTDYLAVVSGTDVFPGAVVKTPTGILTENVVELAGGSDSAVGVAVTGGGDGDQVRVRSLGVISLPDWSLVTGTPTLEDPEYYLNSAGTWTDSSGSQWVASRVGPLSARIRCS